MPAHEPHHCASALATTGAMASPRRWCRPQWLCQYVHHAVRALQICSFHFNAVDAETSSRPAVKADHKSSAIKGPERSATVHGLKEHLFAAGMTSEQRFEVIPH